MFALIGDFGRKLANNAIALVLVCYRTMKREAISSMAGGTDGTDNAVDIAHHIWAEQSVWCDCAGKEGGNKSGVISSAGFVNTYTKFAPIESCADSLRKAQITNPTC